MLVSVRKLKLQFVNTRHLLDHYSNLEGLLLAGGGRVLG